MSRSAPRTPVRRVIASVLATVALVVGGLVVGAAPASAADGTIQGTITAPDGPANVFVSLYQYSPRYQEWRWTRNGGNATNGSFSIPAAPGEYRLCTGFVDYTAPVPPFSGDLRPACFGGSDPQNATTVVVASGGTVTADFSIPGPSTISGTLYADYGDDDVSPTTEFMVFTYMMFHDEWTQIGGGTTPNGDGEYTVAVPGGGDYRLCARPAPFGTSSPLQHQCTGGTPWVQDGASVTVATGTDLPNTDLTMSLGTELGGVLTDESAQALAGISVTATAEHADGSTLTYPAMSSGEDGYIVQGLSSGTYRLCFSGGGFVAECWQDDAVGQPVLVDVDDAPSYDYDAELALGGSISGVVTLESGGMLPILTALSLYRDLEGVWTEVDSTSPSSFNGGAYTFESLPPGVYRICAHTPKLNYVDECWQNAPDVTAATDIPLAAGDAVTGRNVALATASTATVTGDISFSGGSPPAGEPYGSTGAYVDGPDGWVRVANANATSDFTWSMQLPAGTYRFCSEVLFQNWAPNCWGGAVVEDGLDVVVPSSGQGPVLGIQLVPSASISGTIRNTSGDGLSDTKAVVRYLTEGGEFVTLHDAFPNATTDFFGNYSISPLPAGSYLVEFVDVSVAEPHYITEYHDDSLSVEGATLVQLEAGESLDLDAVLALEGEVVPGEVTITGVPQTPNELTADTGSWVPAPDSFAYQWFAGDQPIDGETNATLQLTPDLVDASVSVHIEAQYGDDTIERVSDPVTILPVFADVASNHFFSDQIVWMREQSISNGYLDEQGVRTYHPLESVSRQAMAAFLYRLEGSPSFEAPEVPSFSDVPTESAFYLEIEWLKAEGITVGNADGTFSPLDAVSRQAMAAFLYRSAGSPEFTPPAESSFTDVTAGAPFSLEIEWLLSEGITTGYDDGDTVSYHPVEDVSRQAMAVFLYRTEH